MHCCPRTKTKKKTSFRFEACLKNKKCLFFTTLFVWTDESNVELCERKTVRDKKRHSIPLSKPTYAEIEVIPKGSHFYFIILFLFFVLVCHLEWSPKCTNDQDISVHAYFDLIYFNNVLYSYFCMLDAVYILLCAIYICPQLILSRLEAGQQVWCWVRIDHILGACTHAQKRYGDNPYTHTKVNAIV